MENKFPEAIIPPLPEKKASFTRQTQNSDNIDPVFVDRRRVGLEVGLPNFNFLNCVLTLTF